MDYVTVHLSHYVIVHLIHYVAVHIVHYVTVHLCHSTDESTTAAPPTRHIQWITINV